MHGSIRRFKEYMFPPQNVRGDAVSTAEPSNLVLVEWRGVTHLLVVILPIDATVHKAEKDDLSRCTIEPTSTTLVCRRSWRLQRARHRDHTVDPPDGGPTDLVPNSRWANGSYNCLRGHDDGTGALWGRPVNGRPIPLPSRAQEQDFIWHCWNEPF